MLTARGGAEHSRQLLDTGARKLSAEEFRRDIVQRSIVGPTPAGATIELMYVANGSIVGMGNMVAAQSQITSTSFGGEWTIDDAGRICASLRTSGSGSTFGGSSAVLPPRCQTWFKLGDAYFISDSDSDRRAKVLRRTIMPSSIVAPQNNLARCSMQERSSFGRGIHGEMLFDAPVVGPTSIGGKWKSFMQQTARCVARKTCQQGPFRANGRSTNRQESALLQCELAR